MGSISHILVRAPNWIGDAVMGTPALMDLRAAYPESTITLWARPTIAELLRGHPGIDEVFIYDHKARHKGLFGKMALIREMRARHFGMALLLQNAFEAALLTFLSGVRERWGYMTDGRRLFLSRAIPVPKQAGRVHQVEYFQRLIGELTGVQTKRAPNLVVQEEEEQLVDKEFPSLARGNADEVIGVNPGSVYGTAKRWLPERFAEAADQIIENRQRALSPEQVVKCVIVGGPGEEDLGRTVGRYMKHPSIVLSGKTTIRQLLVIIKRCSLFLTNDTGPMHIACAFGVPVVAIFGSTDPAHTAPPSNLSRTVRSTVRCSPCLLRHCPIDHRCMTGISVEDVCQAALKVGVSGSKFQVSSE
ncbi:MAG: lipopolysaccharide heptosyltransferase II [Nitrospirota bacterium]|nr:MAG: lipopolysaccharide heptosyltransferase II [Nitrospirota bacterium]